MERVRLGMVGGGTGAFIGAVHRMAARLDGEADLVCGAFSSTAERSASSGRELGIDPNRTYGDWRAMLAGEAALPPDRRAEIVCIVTPNDSHFEIARASVERGFHVICDKPMVVSVEQAGELEALVRGRGVVFGVTYNYTGYPLVRAARRMIASGELGQIRKVFVEYHQGWLATPLESGGQKQASWRVDPARAGAGGALGDIGSHAENLVSFVTGLRIESLCADLTAFVPGRKLDDDASVLLRFAGGARGTLTCSQVCVGEENNLSLRVYGTRGSLAWRQESPNELMVTDDQGVRRVVTRGSGGAGPHAAAATRLPGGHPEGFIEAFANVYRGVFAAVRGTRGREDVPFPDVGDGARGVRFIAACVESARRGSAWVEFA